MAESDYIVNFCRRNQRGISVSL